MATVRKKVDNRIRVQIENGVALQHRTMFVVVGDRGRDQVIFPQGEQAVTFKGQVHSFS